MILCCCFMAADINANVCQHMCKRMYHAGITEKNVIKFFLTGSLKQTLQELISVEDSDFPFVCNVWLDYPV